MNILELCLSSGLGGLELYVFRSAKALSENTSNNVISVLSKNSKLDNYFREHSIIKSIYIKHFFKPMPLFNALRLAKIIDNHNIEAIHMHWGKDLPLAALSKAFSRQKPALIYTRQMMITRAKNDFYHHFLYRQIDLLLTITQELETLCKKYIPRYSNKVKTLYYGVNEPEKFLTGNDIHQQRKTLGLGDNDFVVGLIGRLEKNKGQHLLITAIHQAKQNNQNIHALIIGHEMVEGYRGQLKRQAEELGVSENIKFLDFTSQPQQLMQICDCVLLASGQETFGLVLPEAMRAGIAVIGSNSGGVPEIIEHEKTGLLFDTESADSLYQQILKIYIDPTLRSQLAEQGKEKADTVFNSVTHFRKLSQYLTQLITDKKKC